MYHNVGKKIYLAFVVVLVVVVYKFIYQRLYERIKSKATQVYHYAVFLGRIMHDTLVYESYKLL